jgi:ABC-2 type transport system ATP-binding protein
MLIIDIQEKRYADKIILQNASVEINNFGIYGVVGKNGQGKTTFFKCILGLEKYKGKSEFRNIKTDLQSVAWLPTDPKIYNELTANEFYDFYRSLLDINSDSIDPLFEIPNDKLIKEFSTGMKKKTYLNAMLQKKYDVYIFDEPFNGLDLEANYILMNYIKKIAENSIVLIASHILELLFKECKKIYLIKNTKIKEFQFENFKDIENQIFEMKP